MAALDDSNLGKPSQKNSNFSYFFFNKNANQEERWHWRWKFYRKYNQRVQRRRLWPELPTASVVNNIDGNITVIVLFVNRI